MGPGLAACSPLSRPTPGRPALLQALSEPPSASRLLADAGLERMYILDSSLIGKQFLSFILSIKLF